MAPRADRAPASRRPVTLTERLRHLNVRFLPLDPAAAPHVAAVWSACHPSGGAVDEYFYPDGDFGLLLPLRGNIRVDGVPLVGPVLDTTLMKASHGSARIAELARAVGSSERQLERLFEQRVGLSPKRFSRIIRADAARKRIREPGPLSLAEVAQALGFADQAHLTRDFTAHFGITPGRYRRRRAALIACARRAGETPPSR